MTLTCLDSRSDLPVASPLRHTCILSHYACKYVYNSIMHVRTNMYVYTKRLY